MRNFDLDFESLTVTRSFMSPQRVSLEHLEASLQFTATVVQLRLRREEEMISERVESASWSAFGDGYRGLIVLRSGTEPDRPQRRPSFCSCRYFLGKRE